MAVESRPTENAPELEAMRRKLEDIKKLDDELSRAEALVDIAPSIPPELRSEALALALELLSSEDPNVRRAAVGALSGIKSPEAVIHLIQALKDENARVRKATEEVLEKILSTQEAPEPSRAPGEKKETPAEPSEKELQVEARALADLPSEEDYLGYKVYAEVIADFIRNAKTGKPITIAIMAPWGMGKTTLMRMIQGELTGSASRRGHGGFPTVWFNAWKYDREESLWAALVLEIINQLREQTGPRRWAPIWLSLFWKRLDKAGILVHFGKTLIPSLGLYSISLAVTWILTHLYLLPAALLSLVFNLGGVLALGGSAFWAFMQSVRTALPFNFRDYLREPDYKTRIGFLAEFEEDFARVVDAVTGNGRWPLVVFIDDLDRCAPPKPVEILGAINYLIDAKHCVFIIGMDEQAVARSIEARYEKLAGATEEEGGRSLGIHFVEKIVQIPFRIPPLQDDTLRGYVDKLLGGQEAAPEGRGKATEAKVSPRRDETALESKESAEVKQAAEFIQAERRAGEKDIDRAAEEVSKRLKLPPERVEEAKRLVTERFEDSPHVREAIGEAVGYLERSPRQVKRFINVFRLHAILSKRRGFIEDTKEDLQLLAMAVVMWMRWPLLAQALVKGREPFEKLRDAYERDLDEKAKLLEGYKVKDEKSLEKLIEVVKDKRDKFLDLLAMSEITRPLQPSG